MRSTNLNIITLSELVDNRWLPLLVDGGAERFLICERSIFSGSGNSATDQDALKKVALIVFIIYRIESIVTE